MRDARRRDAHVRRRNDRDQQSVDVRPDVAQVRHELLVEDGQRDFTVGAEPFDFDADGVEALAPGADEGRDGDGPPNVTGHVAVRGHYQPTTVIPAACAASSQRPAASASKKSDGPENRAVPR